MELLQKLFGGAAIFCLLLPAWSQADAGYYMVGEPIQISNGLRVNLAKAPTNGTTWPGEESQLILDAEFQGHYRLHIKIYSASERFEVPLEISPATGNLYPLYSIQFSNDPLFSFKVVRSSTGTVLFDTGMDSSDFIFAEQYLTLSWRPGSENVYGIGENEQESFRHDFSKNLTFGLWAKDQPPQGTANMYGVHPYYTVLENDGNAHSVVIVNSNAQQFSMMPGPTIKYITTGGLLDLYFFLGPTPENTVEQYTEAVGRPPMPPYWGLGFQLSRWGYDSLENMKAAVDRMAQHGIPHDVQYADIDVMHKSLDFTYSRERFAGLPEYIRELKEKGIKFVTIVDPCISIGENPEEYRPFKLGQEMDVWVKKEDGAPVTGKVWPEDPVFFPDYSKNSTREWWITLIREFHDLLEFDGLWIDMNEPANFVSGDMDEGCSNNNLNRPPFTPQIQGNDITFGTICGDHVQQAGKHFDVHSLYGWFESEPTLAGARQATGKRSIVLSRSTFLGSGRWVAHWLGDNWSRWPNLHYSIIGMLQFNQFGIPYNGADICGFLENTDEEMCLRWMQLGAFYPFSRNHNVAGARDQDPGVWSPDTARAMAETLRTRYTLLPYLYTLFYHSATRGGTVVRALWHEFPQDPETHSIDTQFMWGSGLLISPVLTPNTTSVSAYFPDARFYSLSDGREEPSRGQRVELPTPLDTIQVHVRGGTVLPLQQPAGNTLLSRENPFFLLVALDDRGYASGQLFYDDGDSIDTIYRAEYFFAEITVFDNRLSYGVAETGYPGMSSKKLDSITVVGLNGTVGKVFVDYRLHLEFTQSSKTGALTIHSLDSPMASSRFINWELI